jgi:hypothetical protein
LVSEHRFFASVSQRHRSCGCPIPVGEARNFRPRRANTLLAPIRFFGAAGYPGRQTSRMRLNAHRISQPGWTGNVGALRTVKAVQRASPVGPIGHRSMAALVRTVASLFASSIARASVPVSVGRSTIETGVARLAQCQDPRDFASIHPRCKSLQIRLHGGLIVTTMSSPTSDPRSLQQRSSRDVMWSAAGPRWSSLSCCRKTAARPCDNDRARPALHPV